MEKRRLYMDYAATTPVKPEVLEAMMPYYYNLLWKCFKFPSIWERSKRRSR